MIKAELVMHQLRPAPTRPQLLPARVRMAAWLQLLPPLSEARPIIHAARCAYCRSTERLVVHPRLDVIVVCIECLDGESDPIDYDELGVGD